MAMLKQFDTELLIGQISYKQKADIYNVSKGYDTAKKTCTTIERSNKAKIPPVHGYVHVHVHCHTCNDKTTPSLPP